MRRERLNQNYKKYGINAKKKTKRINKSNRVFLKKDQNRSGKRDKSKMSGRGESGGVIVIIGKGRGCDGRRNFNNSNNRNKNQELKFIRMELEQIDRRRRLLN